MAKQGIHPEYKETTFLCGCGAKHVIFSTLCVEDRIDLCSVCHPFYTEEKREVDTAG